jgi:hypothetical protein
MSKSLDFGAVPNDLKRHVRRNPEVLKQIFKDDRSFFNYVQLIPDVIDRVLLNRIKISRIAQPGGKNTFDPINDAIKPAPRYGYSKKCKLDLAFDEEDIETLWKSYLGELENRNPQSIADLPYEAVFLELIFAQLKEDEHLEALYKGVRDDAGSDPADMFDGFIKLFKDDVTGGIIPASNIVVTPAFTAANTVENLELFKTKVAERFWNRDMVMVMAPSKKEFYNQDYRATFGALPYNTQYQKTTLDGTRWEIIGDEGLEGSNLVFLTLRYNLKYLTAGTGDMTRLDFQIFNREMKMLGDWRAGVNYAWPEYIWLNDLGVQ